jgi:hypothetical protein
MSYYMKIRQVGAELFHADGETDEQDDANKRSSPILRTLLIIQRLPSN